MQPSGFEAVDLRMPDAREAATSNRYVAALTPIDCWRGQAPFQKIIGMLQWHHHNFFQGGSQLGQAPRTTSGDLFLYLYIWIGQFWSGGLPNSAAANAYGTQSPYHEVFTILEVQDFWFYLKGLCDWGNKNHVRNIGRWPTTCLDDWEGDPCGLCPQQAWGRWWQTRGWGKGTLNLPTLHLPCDLMQATSGDFLVVGVSLCIHFQRDDIFSRKDREREKDGSFLKI